MSDRSVLGRVAGQARYRRSGAPRQSGERPSVPAIEAVLASNRATREQRSMPGQRPASSLPSQAILLLFLICAWRLASRIAKPRSSYQLADQFSRWVCQRTRCSARPPTLARRPQLRPSIIEIALRAAWGLKSCATRRFLGSSIFRFFRKRRDVTRQSVIDMGFRPIPGQKFIELAHGVAVRHALKDAFEIRTARRH